MTWRVTSIVSGCASGAERGALDAAIELDLGYGGWAPHGWRADDGDIPAIYRERMRESSSWARTMVMRLNIQDADATLMLSFRTELAAGAEFIEQTAERTRRAYLHLVLPAGDRSAVPDSVRAEVLAWLAEERVNVLNVSGPRENEEPGIQATVRDALIWILED